MQLYVQHVLNSDGVGSCHGGSVGRKVPVGSIRGAVRHTQLCVARSVEVAS